MTDDVPNANVTGDMETCDVTIDGCEVLKERSEAEDAKKADMEENSCFDPLTSADLCYILMPVPASKLYRDADP